MVVFKANKVATLGTCFADMSALNVTRENNVGFFMNYFAGVNMAQSPVGITFIDELIGSSRGVIGMPFSAIQRGMQYSDV